MDRFEDMPMGPQLAPNKILEIIEEKRPHRFNETTFFSKMGLDRADPAVIQALILLYRKKTAQFEIKFPITLAVNERYRDSLSAPDAPAIVTSDGVEQVPFGMYDDEFAQGYCGKLKAGERSIFRHMYTFATFPCPALEDNICIEYQDSSGALVLVEPALGAAYLCKAVVDTWVVLVHLNTGEVYAPTSPMKDLIMRLRSQCGLIPGVHKVINVVDVEELRPLSAHYNNVGLHFTRLLYPEWQNPQKFRGIHKLRNSILENVT